jgi:Zn-finger nucleic acid-binding protein
MMDRQGVEIDYCPNCRGVWLDRGELDKLIQLGASQGTGAASPVRHAEVHRRPDFEDSDYGKKRYRHKSWLSDIFD